jgi:hypothetical protein
MVFLNAQKRHFVVKICEAGKNVRLVELVVCYAPPARMMMA